MVETFRWPVVNEFRNRNVELAYLESWWESDTREPVSMYGRRRVGKSWLFRRFAHGKPAVILVASEDTTPDRAFGQFTDDLERVLGLRPRIDSISDLFTILYRVARDEKVLVVVDEFPYLLGATQGQRNVSLTQVQAVMEQLRDDSQIKLILAGSLIAEMERLQAPKSPLHGRLRPFRVEPLTFPDAAQFLVGSPIERLTRFAVAGGMPRYLALLGTGNLRETVVANVLDRRGVLFEEVPRLIHGEIRSPAVHFDILEALSAGSANRSLSVGEIGNRLGKTAQEITSYLETLKALRLIEPLKPVGARDKERNTAWRCSDHFVRFWFRYVRPYQSELEAGADPDTYYRTSVAPSLADHTASIFESETRRWTRTLFPDLKHVGSWWGSAIHKEKRAGRRQSEEIDIVGTTGARNVQVVGEAKWTNTKMGYETLRNLHDYKIPAMRQARYTVNGPDIILASRSGFTKALIDAAETNSQIRLIDARTTDAWPPSER